MADAKLKFYDREYQLPRGFTGLGRSTENAIAFPGDSNVSRFHAEIESRGGLFRLRDLGSSNGTTVNDEPVAGEVELKDGDTILLGGTSRLEFINPSAQADAASGVPDAKMDGLALDAGIGAPSIGDLAAAEMPTVSAGSHTMLYIAGGACVVAVLAVAIAGGVYLLSKNSACAATAAISKPEPGDTIIEPIDIEAEVKNAGCVGKAVFAMDGVTFATADGEPFTAKLDPKEFPDLSDGLDHNLTLVLLDASGKSIGTPVPIPLAFETSAIVKPTPGPEIANANTADKPQQTGGKQVSLIDVQDMSLKLLKQFPGSSSLNISNKQFLQEVQKRSAEFAQEGYYERAAKYRDAINVSFVREQNLDAPLGFILAMSRSKFVADKQGSDEGLWRMSNDFVTANAYNGQCGTETLSDPTQSCAAKAAGIYMKAIVFGVFGGDTVYGAAAFGKTPQDASTWKASLPANRSDVWNSIKTAPEREQLIKFFAAGIVAENPQKFGLKKDRPISELYKLAM